MSPRAHLPSTVRAALAGVVGIWLCSALVVVGVASTLIWEIDPILLVLVTGLVSLGGSAFLGRRGRQAERLGRCRRGPDPCLDRHDGEPAVALRSSLSSRVWVPSTPAICGLTVVAGGAVVAVGIPGLGLVFAALGLLWFGRAALDMRRVAPEGVWLSPDRLVLRSGGVERTVRWEDLALVVVPPDRPDTVRLMSRVPMGVRSLPRGGSALWLEPMACSVPTARLAADASSVQRVLLWCRAATNRTSLATDEGVEQISRLLHAAG